jgi:hypothetical protein
VNVSRVIAGWIVIAIILAGVTPPLYAAGHATIRARGHAGRATRIARTVLSLESSDGDEQVATLGQVPVGKGRFTVPPGPALHAASQTRNLTFVPIPLRRLKLPPPNDPSATL